MKITLHHLLINFAIPAVGAFHNALGDEKLADPNYELTDADADLVAEVLDGQASEIPPIGSETLFGAQTAETFNEMSAQSYRAAADAKYIFQFCGVRAARWASDL